MQIDDLTVDTQFLYARLHDPELRVLDVRTADAYDDAHIPGAFLLELATIADQAGQIPGLLICAEEFSTVMRKMGVHNETTVILYDDNWGMPSARVLWALQRYGHNSVAILGGGWDQWQAENLPVSNAKPAATPGNFTCQLHDDLIAEYDWLIRQIEQGTIAIIDTRTRGEYEQGHLPGAVNWDWMNGVSSQGWAPFKSKQEVCKHMSALGITPDMEIVTYCRTGTRASHTYVLLRRSGFRKVRNYDGSWLEWSVRYR